MAKTAGNEHKPLDNGAEIKEEVTAKGRSLMLAVEPRCEYPMKENVLVLLCMHPAAVRRASAENV